MAVLSGSVSGNSQPLNAQSALAVYEQFLWTVTGTHTCAGAEPIVYDDSLLAQGLGAGRWVALRAASISGYAGASVTPPTGYAVSAVSREFVNFAGTTKDCIVVTLSPV